MRVGAVLGAAGVPWRGGAELVLVDDGSNDETPARAALLAAAHSFVRIVRHGERRGIPAAWRSGLAASRGRLVCTLDADLQYQPEEIPGLWASWHSSGAHIVQGWRSPVGRARDRRYLMSRGLSHLLNGAFGMRLRDNKSAFFLCSRETFAEVLSYERRYHHWQVLVMVAAHRKGFRIHEVEARFLPRVAGTSAFSTGHLETITRVLADVLRARREYRGARR